MALPLGTFPASLSERHREEFRKRGISPEFAVESGCRMLADNEVRDLNFQASLPVDERSHGLQGIGFEYRDISSPGSTSIWRLKPDHAFSISGKPAKYLSRKGDPCRPYYPHTTTAGMKADTSVQVLLTEGEFKTLALAEKICPIASRKTCVIGLQGVNGGWSRDSITVAKPDGSKEVKKEGHPYLIDELETWEWKKRVVYIVFDSDVGTKIHASAFKQNKRSGALGAEYTLALLLRSKGADVRIVEIPHAFGQPKVGIDDYIEKYGPHAGLKLIYGNWVVERDVDKILYKGNPEAFTFQLASEILRNKPDKPPFVIDHLLPEGGVMVIAAAPKVGKSSIALNAALAVANGTSFLGRFGVARGRAAYIQTEIPAWALGERLKLMGSIPDDLLVLTPNRIHLNLWEEDGYNKRRETGNRELLESLVLGLKNQSVSLVIFDPYRHFSSLNENNIDHVTHMFELYRRIATILKAGVIVVHHHRKIARSNVRYEGAEDMSGSGGFFGEPDSILSIYRTILADDTRRFKLVFDTRHAEPLEPLELFRMGGDNAMLWTAEEWVDQTRAGKSSAVDSVFSMIEKGGPITREKISEQTGMSRSTVYRHIDTLLKGRRIKRNGNVYEVSFDD